MRFEVIPEDSMVPSRLISGTISGTMSDEEKEATLKLVKYMTSKESIQERMNAAMRVAPYKDIDAPEDAPQIFKDMVEYTGTITDSVGEYFD